jgi:hypothetical protein
MKYTELLKTASNKFETILNHQFKMTHKEIAAWLVPLEKKGISFWLRLKFAWKAFFLKSYTHTFPYIFDGTLRPDAHECDNHRRESKCQNQAEVCLQNPYFEIKYGFDDHYHVCMDCAFKYTGTLKGEDFFSSPSDIRIVHGHNPAPEIDQPQPPKPIDQSRYTFALLIQLHYRDWRFILWPAICLNPNVLFVWACGPIQLSIQKNQHRVLERSKFIYDE